MASSILIKNIYYMLSYAFKELRQNNYEKIASESFENIEDLFTQILITGISQQLKNGLFRTYVGIEENISTIKGRINIQKTIENRVRNINRVYCEFEEYSENNLYNQILKTTSFCLLKSNKVKRDRKIKLKKLLMYFDSIELINLNYVNWKTMTFYKHNRSYELLMNICYYIYNSLLLTTESGSYKMAHFLNNNLPKLYEKFVLEYYRKNFKNIKVSAKKLAWDLDIEDSLANTFLPEMQTDIFLEYEDKVLIIDTKFYNKSMIESQFRNKLTLRSANLYQVYTYVKNQDKEGKGNVSGMLLYAKTDEEITPDFSYSIGGNNFIVKTLDLNCEFKVISNQLNRIIYENFYKN